MLARLQNDKLSAIKKDKIKRVRIATEMINDVSDDAPQSVAARRNWRRFHFFWRVSGRRLRFIVSAGRPAARLYGRRAHAIERENDG